MYELSIKSDFSAAHRLHGYLGDCARCHGHNWKVVVWARGGELDETGICVDFRELRKHLQDLTSELDHQELNQLPVFKHMNPTSENLARFIYHRLQERLGPSPVRVAKVLVAENENCSAAYYE